jgi:hypothetical protein
MIFKSKAFSRAMRLAQAGALLVVLGGLSACDALKDGNTAGDASSAAASSEASSETGAAVSSQMAASGDASSADMTLVSCASEIGATAADKRVQACIMVSPATHPPCNAANSCAMIDDEIARSCDLMAGQASLPAACQPAPRSQAAAAAVVTRYYAALNAHDYATAWRQWGDNGAPTQTFDQFKAGFAHTSRAHVTIGTLPSSEGAAGSIYQDVPVTVDATLDDGTQQRFTGTYTIRRVNGVDGATAAQLRWHIGMAKLRVAP